MFAMRVVYYASNNVHKFFLSLFLLIEDSKGVDACSTQYHMAQKRVCSVRGKLKCTDYRACIVLLL